MPQESNKGKRRNQEKRGRFSRNKKEEEFESKLLDLTRLAHMKAGGRRFRFRAMMIIGNRKGEVGMGLAKGRDVAQAIQKATRQAHKNKITVPIIGNTIPHQVESKSGSARVLLKPQKKGRGLVAGGTVRVICELCGIKDISSKLLSRSKNKINIARATINSLKKLRPKEKNATQPTKTST